MKRQLVLTNQISKIPTLDHKYCLQKTNFCRINFLQVGREGSFSSPDDRFSLLIFVVAAGHKVLRPQNRLRVDHQKCG